MLAKDGNGLTLDKIWKANNATLFMQNWEYNKIYCMCAKEGKCANNSLFLQLFFLLVV